MENESKTEPSKVTLDKLTTMVSDGAVAIRGKAVLEPAGGPLDKVFPPSHAVKEENLGHGKRLGAKYAFETRRLGGADVTCVLLDSVQSQANRMEEALQALWDEGRIRLPVVEVDFSEAPDVGRVTSLTAPHRVSDALLRDSLTPEGELFRVSKTGKSFTDATVRNATPLLKVCPTGLVFGLWDSTGPKGGLGAKFARTLVSEIIGVGAQAGMKTSSRIDPAGITKAPVPVLKAAKPEELWTDQEDAAEKDEDGNPVPYGKKEKAGKATAINHSNIPPGIDELAGGVTIDYALHTVVLSLAGLRKLGFPDKNDGTAAAKARTALAALGLLAIVAAERRGHDLRSRCLLVPRTKDPATGAGVHGRLAIEAVLPDGSTRPVSLDIEDAIKTYEAAVDALPADVRQAFGECRKPLLTLKPSLKLLHLVQESRKQTGAGEDEGD